MREIIVDTETTGLDPNDGHRVVEVACIELSNHIPTGRHFQTYLNPDRDMPTEAAAIHGLTGDFLADKPRFGDVVEKLLEFIGDAPLVIHNAEFDMRFLNAELARAGRSGIDYTRAIDTLNLTKQKFPGAPSSLDALCKRFGIDNSARTFHGAMLDAELLAEVYLELIGGRQAGLELVATKSAASVAIVAANRIARLPRPHQPSEAELIAHAALVTQLKEPLWVN
jgi:DNA polymerase III subunit epsilon